MIAEKKSQDDSFTKSILYNMGLVGLMGAGAGAATRGVQGLWNLGRRSLTRRPPGAFTPPTFRLTKPTDEEEERKRKERFAKHAAPAVGAITPSLAPPTGASWWEPLMPSFGAEAPPGPGLLEGKVPQWLGRKGMEGVKAVGSGAGEVAGDLFSAGWKEVKDWFTPETWMGHPLAIPGMIAAGSGGLYGGYRLLDWIMDKRREEELHDELTTAQKEYEQALAGQFRKKSEINQDLDHLCDLVERSDFTKQAADFPGQALGVLLAMGGGAGLLSGMIAYNMAKKRTPGALTLAALKRHRRAVGLGQPAPIYATPAPLRLDQPARSAADEDELLGEPLDRDVA